MHSTLGVVEVRDEEGSTWATSRRLGGKSILEWVVRRATDCQRLKRVLVLCGRRQEAAVRLLVPSDVEVLTHSGDPLSATVAALADVQADSLVHVCANNPFVDPVLIDRLATTADAHPRCDYIGYCRGDGRPVILTHLGIFAEWCSAAALDRADHEATGPAERRNVTAYLYGHPERFQIRLIPLPAQLDREDLRLRIDGHEDWEHAQVIYDALGHDECDWRQIAKLLDNQPALRKRMAMLNQQDAAGATV